MPAHLLCGYTCAISLAVRPDITIQLRRYSCYYFNLHQSPSQEMGLVKAAVRSSAVEDTEQLQTTNYSKLNKTCIYLLFWYNATARIY